MSVYRLLISDQVIKFLKKLDKSLSEKIWKKIDGLRNDPRPINCKKLVGRNAYRIRVNDYRIIYEIKDKELIVSVVKAGHRKDVYE